MGMTFGRAGPLVKSPVGSASEVVDSGSVALEALHVMGSRLDMAASIPGEDTAAESLVTAANRLSGTFPLPI